MSAATVGIPLTGSGGSTADVAVDLIAGAVYQYMKLASGTIGSTVVAAVLATTPSAADGGLVVRPIMPTSTAQIGNVGQAQSTPGSSDNYWWVRTVGSTAGSTVVDAQASSVGSTKLFGQVTVANPTTAVTVSSGVVLGAGSSANTIGAIAQGAGSTSVAPWYVISTAAAGAGSTTVDANLSSAGSTRVVGTVNVSSGVVLGAGSSANTLGAVAIVAGSSDNELGGVNLTSGSTAFVAGAMVLAAGSSAVTVGAVGLLPGTTANYQFVHSIAFSSGNVARSSVSTTIDTQLIAANANRKALVIANRTTAQTIGIGFSTAALTTALANVDIYLGPSGFLSFGLPGGLPLYLGPLRGLTISSTTVAASVGITEFS